MTEAMTALRALTDELTAVADSLSEEAVQASAYPSEWTIADVFSHLGSGAEISGLRLAKGIGEGSFTEEDAQPIWDAWNAKPPTTQIQDSVRVSQELQQTIEAVSPSQQTTFEFAIGPFTFDFNGYLELRLNELALHTWDVAVALDGTAQLHPAAVPLIVRNLNLIAGWTAKPQGTTHEIDIKTTDPEFYARVDLQPDKVNYEATEGSQYPDLVMPAEAFIRLVYGRLDSDHTPAVTGDPATLDLLRSTFPGP